MLSILREETFTNIAHMT